MLGLCNDVSCRPGAHFEATRVRVAFDQHGTAFPVGDFEAIEAAWDSLRHDSLPDPGGAQTVHAVYAPPPVVEIADDRDL